MKLSACMIVRNEASVLRECLDSLADEQGAIYDELVVVMAGPSTDDTEAILTEYGARIYHWPPPDGEWPRDDEDREVRHYGDARNACANEAKGDYLLWIDGDEKLIKGHDMIRRVVQQDIIPGVRPHIVINRSEDGIPQYMARQTLIYKRGQYTWRGAFHEFTHGLATKPLMDGAEPAIIYEEISRPEGDHSHGETFSLLRRNLADTFNQRDLFYVAREHANASNWQECVAVVRLMLDGEGQWPEQRAMAASLMAQAYMALGDWFQARKAWLRCIDEFGNWAEPYYGLALICRDLGLWQEAIAWGTASLMFSPDSEFANLEIYEWRRYDVIGFCLAATEDYRQAARYYRIVMDKHPNDVTRKNLSIIERKAAA